MKKGRHGREEMGMGIPKTLAKFACKRCGQIHKVVIFREGTKFRVEPGRLVVEQGATVRFISTGPSFTVWFPPEAKAKQLDDPAPNQALFKINADPGAIPYVVYCKDANGADLAEGGSAPRIIIADP